jgi:recombination protein RecT
LNAIAKITDVNSSVEGWRDDFSRVLSSDVDPDKFIAAVTTALTLNPDIARECTAESIKNACIKAAYDGLRPDGKEGALVAYYNKDIKAKEATWMPMVFGLRKKAKDHDNIIITAREVRQGDEFSVVYGLKEDLKHVPLLSEKKRGPIVATYAVFRRGDEVLHFEVMTKEDIDQVRSASKAPNSPAWNNWYGEMGKKAAANRGSKSVPMSDAVRQIIDRDNDHYDLGGIKDVTPARPSLAQALQGGKSNANEGFSLSHVQTEIGGRQVPMEIIDQDTGEVTLATNTGAQPSGDALKTTA